MDKVNEHNQDYKYDKGKLRYDLVPHEPLEELAKIFTYGIKKGYGENSWKDVEPFESRYYAAAERHLMEWRKGNTIDLESGERHLSHLLWNIAVLLTKEIQKEQNR